MAKKPARKPAPKKAPAKKAAKREPETKPRDAGDVAIYEEGRTARNSSIPRDSSPYPKGKHRNLWHEGWDFQHEALS